MAQHLWNINVVKIVGNALGDFVKIDLNFENREQIMTVRICVKLNIHEPL